MVKECVAHGSALTSAWKGAGDVIYATGGEGVGFVKQAAQRALMKMMGTFRVCGAALNWRHNSYPSISGIIMSSRIRSGGSIWETWRRHGRRPRHLYAIARALSEFATTLRNFPVCHLPERWAKRTFHSPYDKTIRQLLPMEQEEGGKRCSQQSSIWLAAADKLKLLM